MVVLSEQVTILLGQTMATLNTLDQAFACSNFANCETRNHSIVSIIGNHAGEGTNEIFRRKSTDIERIGQTFWLVKSFKARPPQVQQFCEAESTVYTIFIESATKNGARPTTTEDAAKECSVDRVTWNPLPPGMGPVTGKIDGNASALVFDELTVVNGILDLWSFADFQNPQVPLKFMLGCSTVCAVRKDMTEHPDKIKSRHRKIVAVARLAKPYCVWLR